MEIIKEIIGAMNSRFKSHFFGSILISFIVINWKPLYFLFFSDQLAFMKFNFFEDNTSIDSLLWLPLLYGVTIALLTPWIALFGTFWALLPTKYIKDLHAAVASSGVERDYKLETKRAAAKAKHDLTLVDAAVEIQKGLDEISDPDVKDKLKGELDRSSEKDDHLNTITAKLAIVLSPLSKTILDLAERNSVHTFDVSYTQQGQVVIIESNGRVIEVAKEDHGLFEDAINELVGNELINNISHINAPNTHFIVTPLGMDVSLYLKNIRKL